MIIDCDTCEVRGDACGDCVIGVLIGAPLRCVELHDGRALDVLADQGLVPKLRLVAGPARRAPRATDRPPSTRDVG